MPAGYIKLSINFPDRSVYGIFVALFYNSRLPSEHHHGAGRSISMPFDHSTTRWFAYAVFTAYAAEALPNNRITSTKIWNSLDNLCLML